MTKKIKQFAYAFGDSVISKKLQCVKVTMGMRDITISCAVTFQAIEDYAYGMSNLILLVKTDMENKLREKLTARESEETNDQEA